MKKQTKHQYDNMMQVYRKMHEEVAQLAQQVLELDDEKEVDDQLPSDILYEVSETLFCYSDHDFIIDLDWLLERNTAKKFLEACLMFLHSYIDGEDMYEVFDEYLDKKQD